ncbi:MAG TPA: hypothetical protein PLL30_16220 [Candidatus Krumholzibacteria bacterium]|nr:hypothetical protein [Candidatus Krumholzibacteria bacterium]HPD73317.1 hypothetical protein [Candidatus Krumholzibacteria bacterium]HRY42033.1 hypothetical protein [Candidatus Krumholzibacteria bacterium]
MPKRATSEQSFVFAVVVPGPSLKLHEFVKERIFELGESSCLAVWWRLIGHPAVADPIYKSLRSPALVRRDAADAKTYRRLCEQAGSEDLYQRGEYFNLARMYDLREDQLPAVVFVAHPAINQHAKLLLAPSAFETGERLRTLACFIYDELGERRILQFAEDGVFTADSMARLQKHLDQVGRAIARSIAKGTPVSTQAWNTYLRIAGLEEREDPAIRTAATAWRRHGSLYLRTETNGAVDGEVEFPLYEGKSTLQMRLMWQLLLAWPRGVAFRDLAEDLYARRFQAALRDNDRDALAAVAKTLRSLISDIRYAKLEKNGINPEILPAPGRTSFNQRTLRLQLMKLDRLRLGRPLKPRS